MLICEKTVVTNFWYVYILIEAELNLKVPFHWSNFMESLPFENLINSSWYLNF